MTEKTEMDNCEKAREMIPLHAGEDLGSPEKREWLKGHLRECESCSSLLEEYHTARSSLQQFLTGPEAGMVDWDEFHEELQERIASYPDLSTRTHQPQETRSTSSFVSLFSLKNALSAAALLLLGIGIGWYGLTFFATLNETVDHRTEVSNTNAESTATPQKAQKESAQTKRVASEEPNTSTSDLSRASGLVRNDEPSNSATVPLEEYHVKTNEQRSYFLNQGVSPNWQHSNRTEQSTEPVGF